MLISVAPVLACRSCGASTEVVWNLGSFPIVGFPEFRDSSPQSSPLVVMLCTNRGCGLVQLAHSVPQERLFREYWYRSGTNEAMVAALHNVVDQALARQPLNPGDWVMDIGANDGTLLAYYKTRHQDGTRLAFEPADNLRGETLAHCEVLCDDFFPIPPLSTPPPKIITACAMAYDLEDPNAFFAGIAEWLAPDGLFVLQVGYLGALFAQNAFDSICHEHVEYYSLTSLVSLLARHRLCVVDVERNDVNGGSLRCYVRHGELGERMAPVVLRTLNEEGALGFTSPEPWTHLKLRCDKLKGKVFDTILAARRRGPIDLYGASTKGLTLVEYWSLAPYIRYAVDRAPQKIGRFYGGTGIQITDEDTWRLGKGALAIVLPWHFKEGILLRERKWREEGGEFLFPLPAGEVCR